MNIIIKVKSNQTSDWASSYIFEWTQFFLLFKSAIYELNRKMFTCIICFKLDGDVSSGSYGCSSSCWYSDALCLKFCSEVEGSQAKSFFRLKERPSTPFGVWTIASKSSEDQQQDLPIFSSLFLENSASSCILYSEQVLLRTECSSHSDRNISYH